MSPRGVFVLLVVACLATVAIGSGEVETLEASASASDASRSMNLEQVRQAGETMATARKRSHRGFNILGFFGCCFHCKHDPACTENCMAHHHIQNGFGHTEASEERESMAHDRLVKAAHAIAFIQEAAGVSHTVAHKPIKLHLSEGHGKYHPAPERPQPSTDSKGAVSAASDTLEEESKSHKSFSTTEFFHCAFSCHHKVSCEESCMKSHSNMNSLHIQRSAEDSRQHLVVNHMGTSDTDA